MAAQPCPAGGRRGRGPRARGAGPSPRKGHAPGSPSLPPPRPPRLPPRQSEAAARAALVTACRKRPRTTRPTRPPAIPAVHAGGRRAAGRAGICSPRVNGSPDAVMPEDSEQERPLCTPGEVLSRGQERSVSLLCQTDGGPRAESDRPCCPRYQLGWAFPGLGGTRRAAPVLARSGSAERREPSERLWGHRKAPERAGPGRWRRPASPARFPVRRGPVSLWNIHLFSSPLALREGSLAARSRLCVPA